MPNKLNEPQTTRRKQLTLIERLAAASHITKPGAAPDKKAEIARLAAQSTLTEDNKLDFTWLSNKRTGNV